MKKLLGLALSLVTIGFLTSSSEAKAAELGNVGTVTANANAAPQWQRDNYGRRWDNRRHARVFTRTRVVRQGRRLYRETYQVRVFQNGRVDTRLISRVRVA